MQTYSLELVDLPRDPHEPDTTLFQRINNHGQMTGQFVGEPYWWNGGQWTQITTDRSGGRATGINDDGLIVGLHHDFPPTKAFVYEQGKLTDILPSADSYAAAVNNSGLVVGTEDNQPFTWDWKTRTLTKIRLLPGHIRAEASAVNDQGHVVGISRRNLDVEDQTTRQPNPYQLFFYSEGKDPSDARGDVITVARMNNADVVCGTRRGAQMVNGSWPDRAYRAELSSGTAVFEDIVPASDAGIKISNAYDINDAGVVVGSCTKGAFVHYPTGHPNHGFHVLGPQVYGTEDWFLQEATGINDHGIIVGNGTFKGAPRSFKLIPARERSPLETKALQFLVLFGAVTAGGSGIGLLPGGKLKPIPEPLWDRLNQAEKDLYLGAAIESLSRAIGETPAAKLLHDAGLQITEQAIEELPEPS
ncbi:hypothetical protein LJR078_001759 [Arthrobacter sp. LjRoot78]|uniref:hypothetical protein n=1 Tax=Arthrobacter sp. LjRoot78 TaxID=3342338 RepID=UPI003ECE8971